MTEVDPILPPPSPTLGASPTGVYELIHALHTEILEAIDSALDWDELKAPSVNYTIVRPIIEKFAPTGDDSRSDGGGGARASLGAVLYACMANRIHFTELADSDLSYQPLQESRAEFCELIAIKFLRTFPNPNDEAELASQLVRQWCALDGAPEDVWRRVDDREEAAASKSSALDIAIVASAKRFVAQPVLQHILQEIGCGNLTYAPQQTVALIRDTYVAPRHNHNPLPGAGAGDGGDSSLSIAEAEAEARGQDVEVYAYNPYLAGWLDPGRLRVPRWRHAIEFATFFTLLVLFCITLTNRSLGHITKLEIFYIFFTSGFILDELASIVGSGLLVHFTNVWNAFDLSYIAIFLTYFFLRMHALYHNDKVQSDRAFDILACGACFLFPRLIFYFLKNNAVILSLQGMIATMVGFMCMISIAFTGIGFTLWRLGTPMWTVDRVARLMFKIWFSKGFNHEDAVSISPELGPIVLTMFAFLCSNMLFSMMVSMMSSKYAAVQKNAQQEYLFQRAVSTLEALRADSLFSYIPPFNLPAALILAPLSYVLEPATMHAVNLFCIRLANFPVLLAISAFERHRYRSLRRAIRLSERGHHKVVKTSLFGTIMGGESTVIRAAFDLAPPVKIGPPGTPTKDLERGPELKPPAPERPAGRTNANTLARLFNKAPARARGGSVGAAPHPDAHDWEDMRDAQTRIETMLSTFMAASGIDPPTKGGAPKSPEKKPSTDVKKEAK
ncbi:hypothetical protein CC85DRAFT_258274 [Cutaneotrichosporon oleaginosum]|uniref:Receptor-activated Ca2+-permeable cation channel n=1 Tax=Cutaneotrichosporon oleaginosum TaxID=879819 RepID=A0A0J0XR63_9TREE|nr:uncharacterized protein CC85DRAFT_258274 [Cutaneotrichosporon oleaginosum]KLT43616.1 hypothetical protein CC85DRAFT_258274 [Cutaneotrichosporon oleaginosum]TXT12716.1 hypothetical protein COLE_03126 [Cutaneotrichosporon oleaginosum]